MPAHRLHRAPSPRPAVEWHPPAGVSQRWHQRTHSWVRTSQGGFDPSRYTVEPVSVPVARDYVQTHHYSGSFPADRFRFGLFHHDRDGQAALVGVAVFGIPMSAKVLTNPLPDLEPLVESIELSRLVLEGERGGAGGRAPANSESWFVARCFRELAVAGIRGVVAFSDPVPRRVAGRTIFPGHHYGTTYQALNGRYLGRATARTLTLLPDGTVLSDRAAQKVRGQERGHEYVERRLVSFGASAPLAGERDMASWLADALETVGATRLRHPGNLRYVFPIGARRRQVRFGYAPQPYVKAATAA